MNLLFRRILLFFICFHTIVVVSMANGENEKAFSSLRGNGLCFTPNMGQIADIKGRLCPEVLYKGETPGADIYLRKTGISYIYSNIGDVMHKISEQVSDSIHAGSITEMDKQKKQDELLQAEKIKVHRVDMDFVGCLPIKAFENRRNNNVGTTNSLSSLTSVMEEDELQGYNNYYYGHCPNGILNVRQYSKVTYKNIYNNIDVAYYGDKQNGIKYDLIVHPHADPNQIKLHWKGAESIKLNHEGNLVIKTSVNEFTESIPKVYQVINGEVIDVKAKYVLNRISKGEAIIGFSIFNYNTSFPLVIDPWATYYGGNQIMVGLGMAADNMGNVSITGHTVIGALPTGNSGGANVTWQPAFGGGSIDAFVVKFDASGKRLWATYYGGNQDDDGKGIATDTQGNVIITGMTAGGTFPASNTGGVNVTWQSAYGGGIGDAFIVKFDASGKRLWASYYGGSDFDIGMDAATDTWGNIVITGATEGATFPANNAGGTNITFQTIFGGLQDVFVIKFDTVGNRLWATYYGGNDAEASSRIATDNKGNMVITGYTYGSTFPVGNTVANVTWQPTAGGGYDTFVVKFDGNGNRLWATYYGGDKMDEGFGIATDKMGNVVIVGWTEGGTFPANNAGGQNVTCQATYGGGTYDAFVIKFDSTGKRLWATYFGESQHNWAWEVATDANNNVYVLMETEEAATPTLIDACSLQPVFNGGSATNQPGIHPDVEDQTILKLNPNGVKLCATYLGGTGEDDLEGGHGMAVYNNSLYITSATDGGFPVTSGTAQPVYGGASGPNGFNVYVASLCINICEGTVLGLNIAADNTTVSTCQKVKFTPTIKYSCDTTNYKFHWTFTGGNPSNSDSKEPLVSYSGVGAHDVKLVITTPCKKDSLTMTSFITVGSCGTLSVTAGKTDALCNGGNSGIAVATAISGAPGYTYSWSTGAISITSAPTDTLKGLIAGNYTVTIIDANLNSATATVTIDQPAAIKISVLQSAPASCGKSNGVATVLASGGTGTLKYTWSSGATTITAGNISAGNYTVTITDINGCSLVSTVSITEPPPITIAVTPTNASCGRNDGTITTSSNGGIAPYTYSWSQGGGNNSSVINLASGAYTVTVTDSNSCSATATVTIENISTDTISVFPFQQTIEEGNSIILTATGGGTYTWSPPATLSCSYCVSPIASPTVSTTYTVTGRDSMGCIITATVNIIVKRNCSNEDDIFVPNVFSPNNDGKNDMLFVEGHGLTNIYWAIYDRWGNRLFEAYDQMHGWDGTYNGKTMDNGTYVYYLKATCLKTNSEVRLKGNVSIVH